MKAKIRQLFSRLTVFDYIVGVSIVGVVLFLVLFLRRGSTTINVVVKVTNPDVMSAYARPYNEYVFSFIEGDVELNELGQVNSSIEEVRTIYTGVDFPSMYLTLKVKALYSPLKKQYSLKGKPVVYGQGYTFTFSNVKFEGIIVNFPGFEAGEELEEDTIKLKAQMKEDSRSYSDVYGVLPFLANAVKAGDEVRDREGNTVVKVVGVEVKPAKRTVLANDGTPRIVDDPLLKDVSYELEVKIKKSSTHKFYQDFIVVQIGETLPLIFKDVSVYPTITEIIE